MRPVSKIVLALTVFGSGLATAAEDLSLPALPAAPAVSGGDATAAPASLPALPVMPAGSAPADPLPAAPAPAEALPALPATTAATTVPPRVDAGFGIAAGGASSGGGSSGKIVGGRVNIRAGEGTKYEIVLTAAENTPVTVYKRNGEWVQIAYPESESCYVELSAIDGDVPSDIPEGGVSRTVKGGRILSRPWQGSTEIGQLTAGESVTVLGVRNQCAKIKPPTEARAYVFYKYVSFEKGSIPETGAVAEAPAAATKPGATTSRVTTGRSGRDVPLQNIKGDSDPVLDVVRQQNALKSTQKESSQSVSSILSTLQSELRATEESSEQQMRAIEASRAARRAQPAPMPVVDENYRPQFAPGSEGGKASGFVEYVGSFYGKPAYRLVQGGVVMYLLVSTKYDLHRVIGKRVLLNGTITPRPNWDADQMNVDFLRLYNDPNTPLEEVAPSVSATDEGNIPVRVNDTRRSTVDNTVVRRRDGGVVVDITGLPNE